ncbi:MULTISPECIES: DUF378 domain-containing protein [Clostridium]|uniref:DUF378 domain-containing protein n=2 Tax=Clostridium TaxID=1485 RepID=A0ABW8T1Z6_9CLOT
MRTLDALVLLFVVIGAVNWGLIGFFNFNLISALFGEMTTLSRVIYAVVGIAGIYAISFFGRDRGYDRHDEVVR